MLTLPWTNPRLVVRGNPGTQRGRTVVVRATPAAKKGVLFVCLGNICRSPTAEAVFRMVTEKNGRSSDFDIDSCGTGGGNPSWYQEGGWSYHEGEPSDGRMTRAASARNVFLTSRSRPLKPQDFDRFDFIVGMDEKNIQAIKTAMRHWKSLSKYDQVMPPLEECEAKLRLMTRYCRENTGAKNVPDPYYGGAEGFEVVLDLLQDACEGFLSDIDQDKA